MNHLDLVGWVNTARYKWAEIMGREIKFKPATFYLGIADHLARVVEGAVPQEEPQPASRHGKSRGEREEIEQIRQEGERVEMAESLGKGDAEHRVSGEPSCSGSSQGDKARPESHQR